MKQAARGRRRRRRRRKEAARTRWCLSGRVLFCLILGLVRILVEFGRG